MRSKIKKLIDAANVIDRAYDVKSRAMAVKPNIIVLFYAIANSDNLSQSQLHNEWLLPLTTINTITTECRNAGYITLEPIPGKRRECYLRFTEKGRKLADVLLSDIHKAEEIAMAETVKHFSPNFVEAIEFYAKTFHQVLNVDNSKED